MIPDITQNPDKDITVEYLDAPDPNAIELEPAVVKPDPVKAQLRTYYPGISVYPFTGHSELTIYGPKGPRVITATSEDYNYNLLTNNCSDCTRRAVEKAYGEKINPWFFTTPGDVKDFLSRKGIKPKSAGRGVVIQDFKIPFATAMDLKNEELDKSNERYRRSMIEWGREQQKLNPNFNWEDFNKQIESKIDEFNSIYRYEFKPFINKEGGKIEKHQIGKVIGKGLKWFFTKVNKAARKSDNVAKSVQKLDNPGYINTIDDAIPERQPLTMQRSPQFWGGTSKSNLSHEELLGLPKSERAGYRTSLGKSKITPEERMGIPKGERNNGKYNGITFFRTLDQVPEITPDGYVQVSSPFKTFSNWTTDNLVHLHDGYKRLKNHVLAVDPEAFKGSTLMSLEPSDHVFINETLKIKPKHITFISGDADAIALAKQRGFNVLTTPEMKIYYKRANDYHGYHPPTRFTNDINGLSQYSDNRNAYNILLREAVTNNFTRPGMEPYIKMGNQTGLSVPVKPFTGKNFMKTWDGVKWSPSDFRSVVYDPASPIEARLMSNYGLDYYDDRFNPYWQYSESWGDRQNFYRIRRALDEMKQNVKPLKQGGKINA